MTRSVVVLASKDDPAGTNIASRLLPKLASLSSRQEFSPSNAKLLFLDGDLVSLDGFPETLSPRPDLVIFASRHESESGQPCLTVHPPGNIGAMLHGGRPRSLSMASPIEMQLALRALKALNADPSFKVTLEATHHGPLTDVPSFFIEIGSDSSRWQDRAAGEVLALAISRVVSEPVAAARDCTPVAVAFGGPHYAPGFTELVAETQVSVSHLVPKHQVGEVDDVMLEMLFERSMPRARFAVLDWKGIRGEDRRQLVTRMDRMGLKHFRLRDCLEGRVQARG